VINKVSFYCYLFLKPHDRIARYDILWGRGDRYLLKYCDLNPDFSNQAQKLAVTVYNSLPESLASIILQLRNLEVQQRVYKHLQPAEALDDCYDALIKEFADSIHNQNIKSFSVFGHTCKFRPLATAKNFLKSMGYFVLTSKRPHVYVLDDFIKIEQRKVFQ
jgi:hypothetical protein